MGNLFKDAVMPKKHQTMPGEPDEMPVQPERPDIQQPSDPGEPQTPEEAPGNLPQEVPPGEAGQPEIKPDDQKTGAKNEQRQESYDMKKQVLFIQGGGDGGYEADTKLVASLQKALGKDYEISYPRI